MSDPGSSSKNRAKTSLLDCNNNNMVEDEGNKLGVCCIGPTSDRKRRRRRRKRKNVVDMSGEGGRKARCDPKMTTSPLLASPWAAAALAVAVYVNSIDGDFVHDDIPAIVRNPDVTGQRSLASILSDDFWGCPLASARSHKSYRPLTTLLFRLNHWLCPGATLSFHLTSLTLHAAATGLVHRITHDNKNNNKEVSWSVAPVLFALHPVHAEAVAGIVGSADVLACVLTLLSTLSYMKCLGARSNNSQIWHLLSLTLSALALLAKESGIMSFAINLGILLDLMSKRKKNDDDNAHLRTMFAQGTSMMALLAMLRLVMCGSTPSSILPIFSAQDNPAAFHPDPLVKLLTFLYLPAHNFWLLLCPDNLSYDWQMGSIPLITSITDARNSITLTFYLGLMLLSWKGLNSSSRQFKLGMLFLVLPFLPASNVFFNVGFVVAERILYTPSVGFCLLVDYGFKCLWNQLRSRRSRQNLLYFFYFILTVFALKTVVRNRDWHDRESLFRSGLKSTPNNAKVHYNYGNWLRETGQSELAEEHYRLAIRLWPSYTVALNNLAAVVSDGEEAERHLRAALEADPGHANSLFNVALILRGKGHCEKAVPLLERCIMEDQNHSRAHLLLAECIRQNKSETVVNFVTANGTRLKEATSDKTLALRELAEAYVSIGEWTKARSIISRMIDQ